MSILNEKQQTVLDEVFINDLITEICLYGSGRSGKTFLTADYVLERAIAYPGSFHLYIRATMTALTAGVVTQTFPNLFRAIEQKTGINLLEAKASNGKPFIVHRANPHNKYILYNGSEIRFVGLDTESTNKSAIDKILSQEYLTVVFEEGTEIGFEVVERVKTRLAQKVKHFMLDHYGRPKWIVTLNPRTPEDWDYVYFQEHKNPLDMRPLKDISKTAFVHFHVRDNQDNISEDYLGILEGMSLSQQKRFLDGEHGDNYEGEIFKEIFWEPLPPIHEFEKMIIYTDPSYKSGPKNDFKSSVVVGLRQGAYWVIDGRAMQCTTAQMVLNVHDLYNALVIRGWHKPVGIYFENAGMPDDFTNAIQSHAERTKWVCPYVLDNRVKGDKFARIETILEPLNRNGKLYFNSDFRKERFGTLVVIQFLNFRAKLLPTEHDDIPDSVHGAVTMIQMPQLRPGQTKMINKLGGPTL